VAVKAHAVPAVPVPATPSTPLQGASSRQAQAVLMAKLCGGAMPTHNLLVATGPVPVPANNSVRSAGHAAILQAMAQLASNGQLVTVGSVLGCTLPAHAKALANGQCKVRGLAARHPATGAWFSINAGIVRCAWQKQAIVLSVPA
jgi:hypothetical protein